MNIYGVLADLVAAVHLVYVAFVVLGQLAIMIGWPLGWRWIRNPWLRSIHLVMILIVAAEAVVEFRCPLTTWENNLRALAGQREAGDNTADSGFIARCIDTLMPFDPEWENAFIAGYYVTAGIVLATFILVPPHFRRRQKPPAPPLTEKASTAIGHPGSI